MWQQKTIWLFSALSIAPQLLFRIFPIKPQPSLLVLLLLIGILIISIYFWYASVIGVPYLAYCFSIGRTMSIRETLFAINKFSGRVVGFSCLSVLILVPCFLLVAIFSTRDSAFPANLSANLLLAFLPLSIFNSIWDFSIIGFFAKDLGVRKSIKEAWTLFSNHFIVLASIGIILRGILQIINIIVVCLTLLIQSGFDTTSLSNLNFINPSLSLSHNILFLLINAVVQISWPPFTAFVFILAYLKFSSAKIHS